MVNMSERQPHRDEKMLTEGKPCMFYLPINYVLTFKKINKNLRFLDILQLGGIGRRRGGRAIYRNVSKHELKQYGKMWKSMRQLILVFKTSIFNEYDKNCPLNIFALLCTLFLIEILLGTNCGIILLSFCYCVTPKSDCLKKQCGKIRPTYCYILTCHCMLNLTTLCSVQIFFSRVLGFFLRIKLLSQSWKPKFDWLIKNGHLNRK